MKRAAADEGRKTARYLGALAAVYERMGERNLAISTLKEARAAAARFGDAKFASRIEDALEQLRAEAPPPR